MPKEFQKSLLLSLLLELLLIALKWRQRFIIPRKSSVSALTTQITVLSKTSLHQRNQLFLTNFHPLWSDTVMPSSSQKLAAILVSNKLLIVKHFSRRFGSWARNYHRQRRSSHLERVSLRARFWLYNRQRRIWSGLAKETQRWTVAFGQNIRHLLPTRPCCCHRCWSIEFEDFVSDCISLLDIILQ